MIQVDLDAYYKPAEVFVRCDYSGCPEEERCPDWAMTDWVLSRVGMPSGWRETGAKIHFCPSHATTPIRKPKCLDVIKVDSALCVVTRVNEILGVFDAGGLTLCFEDHGLKWRWPQ